MITVPEKFNIELKPAIIAGKISLDQLFFIENSFHPSRLVDRLNDEWRLFIKDTSIEDNPQLCYVKLYQPIIIGSILEINIRFPLALEKIVLDFLNRVHAKALDEQQKYLNLHPVT